MTDLGCYGNQLTSLDVRNGNNTNFTNFNVTGNANLNCISVDDISHANTNWTAIDSHTIFLDDCASYVSPNADFSADATHGLSRICC